MCACLVFVCDAIYLGLCNVFFVVVVARGLNESNHCAFFGSDCFGNGSKERQPAPNIITFTLFFFNFARLLGEAHNLLHEIYHFLFRFGTCATILTLALTPIFLLFFWLNLDIDAYWIRKNDFSSRVYIACHTISTIACNSFRSFET